MALAAAVSVIAAPSSFAQTGGALAPGPPQVTTVTCLSPAASCGKRRTVLRGREFVVRGSNLDSVERVVFEGAPGARDDEAAPVLRGNRRYLAGTVPPAARSGPLNVVSRGGGQLAGVPRVTVRAAPKSAPMDLTPSSSFFYGSTRKATFSFEVERPVQAQVELVSAESEAVVRSWSIAAQPGQTARVRWDGRGSKGVEPTGRYRFRLAGSAGGSAIDPDATTDFFFADHVFPIRGRHDLGQSPTNSFGGGGTRTHKGQDMFASCGTRLAAARGGRVQFAGYHQAAGNYLVIDGAGTGIDYVYMHLLEPALVKTGDRVFTGQKVGEVGETGRATGCHLHFELWSSPGWYEGGSAFDPLPSLERWDAFS